MKPPTLIVALFVALSCSLFTSSFSHAQEDPPIEQPPDPVEYEPSDPTEDPESANHEKSLAQPEPGSAESILPTRAKEEERAKLDFQTDLFTGQFRYALPLKAAPARGGSEPKLSLSYRSTIENGFCGVGWSLSLPHIQRNTRTNAPFKWVNGQAQQEYSDDEGFVAEFGGATIKLVKITTTFPNEYVAENNSHFTRFFYYGVNFFPPFSSGSIS